MRKWLMGIMALVFSCGLAGCIVEDAAEAAIYDLIMQAIVDALSNLPAV